MSDLTRQQMQEALDEWWMDGECAHCRRPGGGHHRACPIHALSVALEQLEAAEKALHTIAHDHAQQSQFMGDWHEAFNWAQDIAKAALAAGDPGARHTGLQHL